MILAEAGADVNQRDKNGKTSLILAAEKHNSSHDNLECIKVLLEIGADVNMADQSGCTPLLVGPQKSYEIVQLFVNGGADVNVVRKECRRKCEDNFQIKTVLFLIARNYSVRQAHQFLRCGAPVNHRDEMGRNALNVAVILGNRHPGRKAKVLLMMLFAGGETVNGTTVPCRQYDGTLSQLDEVNLDLKNMCRKAIRKHLIQLNPYANLFNRIPQLGLPSLLNEYLLYDCTLEDDNYD